MLILGSMLGLGHFSSGVQSCKAPACAADFAGSGLSGESEDDEHINSERLGVDFNPSCAKRPLEGRS